MKRTQTTFTLISLTALATLGIAGIKPVFADTTQTYSASYGPSTTDYTVTLTLPKFDTTLGTLQEVHVSMSNSYAQNGTVQNMSGSAQDFTVNTTGTFRLKDGGSNLLLTNGYNQSQTYTQLGAGATSTYGPFSGSPSSNVVYTTGTIFNEFNGGPGNINLSFQTLDGYGVSGGGNNAQVILNTSVGVTASVFYVYTTVLTTPEPGAFAFLLGGGVFSALLVNRRRKAGLAKNAG